MKEIIATEKNYLFLIKEWNNWNQYNLTIDVWYLLIADHISGPVLLEQYVAVADYKKQNRNEVNMVAGDIVEVIDKNENGTTKK